ncbi:MAG: YihY/virulence factor BrkB family protein [Elusimicrobia bacterium]|nr:YihY/virulence factor BrkB family protein [Elusimicrobiota bacterium]
MTEKEKSRKLSLTVLISRVWQGLGNNYCFDMAAELGFYFLYSLFPFLIFLGAVAGYFPIASNPEKILRLMKEFLPDYLFTMAGPAVLDLLFKPRKLLAAGTLILAFWSASSAVSALMAALNRIHCVQERRSYWRTKGISLLLTTALIGVILTAVMALVMGPIVRNWLIAEIGFPVGLRVLFGAFRWAIWVTVIFLVLALVFSFGPNIKRPFKLFSYGAFVTLVGQFVFSELFRIYLHSTGPYNLFYGAAGGIIGLMTWLYIMGFMILAGAQVNHELGEQN